jgi:hypothetical protein
VSHIPSPPTESDDPGTVCPLPGITPSVSGRSPDLKVEEETPELIHVQTDSGHTGKILRFPCTMPTAKYTRDIMRVDG